MSNDTAQHLCKHSGLFHSDNEVTTFQAVIRSWNEALLNEMLHILSMKALLLIAGDWRNTCTEPHAHTWADTAMGKFIIQMKWEYLGKTQNEHLCLLRDKGNVPANERLRNVLQATGQGFKHRSPISSRVFHVPERITSTVLLLYLNRVTSKLCQAVLTRKQHHFPMQERSLVLTLWPHLLMADFHSICLGKHAAPSPTRKKCSSREDKKGTHTSALPSCAVLNHWGLQGKWLCGDCLQDLENKFLPRGNGKALWKGKEWTSGAKRQTKPETRGKEKRKKGVTKCQPEEPLSHLYAPCKENHQKSKLPGSSLDLIANLLFHFFGKADFVLL